MAKITPPFQELIVVQTDRQTDRVEVGINAMRLMWKKAVH